MDLLSVIRRWHHREGLAIREIKRRTGLSRNTIRKYLASAVVEPKYPARKSARKLDQKWPPIFGQYRKVESAPMRGPYDDGETTEFFS